MIPYNRGKLSLITCKSGKHFAIKVCEELNKIIKEEDKNSDDIKIINTKETIFANTEIKSEIEESIRNKDIYLFQDVENKTEGLSVNDNLMALKTCIQAAKLSDAHYITVILPIFPYSRQDKPKTREGITAAMIAREIESLGVNRIITLDIHNEAIAGFLQNTNFENLRASYTFVNYAKEKIGTDNLIIVAPDVGAAQRANYYAKKLGVKLAIIHKERDYSKANCIERMNIVGDVKDKKVFVVDDIIDTAGTLVNAAKKLKEEGAKEIYFAASHALLNGPAKERINKAYKEGQITRIIGTNTIYHDEKFKKENKWYEEVELDKYFARVIHNINRGISITKLLD